jgi:tyrosine-protein phosphatase YwqE
MMKLWNWFQKQSSGVICQPLQVDIHSHLIPGIDDGVQSADEAVQLIRGLRDLGYKKIVTTPHIMWGTYSNTPENILGGLEKLKIAVKTAGIQVELEAACEYYFDEHFINLILEENLLQFGSKYVLFELPVMFKPPQLEEIIFELTTRNYIPVLAHPERYLYMHTKGLNAYEKLKTQGVLLQLNMLSPLGYYSKPIQKVSHELIKYGWIDFVGTDMHNERHLQNLKLSFENKHLIELLNQPQLLNNKLLN